MVNQTNPWILAQAMAPVASVNITTRGHGYFLHWTIHTNHPALISKQGTVEGGSRLIGAFAQTRFQ
ncbi:hypothetical protein NADFUDRAFT_83949 [Nadsonia fulvescens var. elongata DSM 6958]|uniref:Uncharacterized protein n=1 Tax=Nadsonia fulvescens var. elongata DSM 6958 TaxID=857566 RepID=A0A1E3PFY2_9ASCO|nr:hypothetical protein NADFUDRAFT_83949 [Nadsonia fulvescens var. elongata DSM 6958]